MYSRLFQKLLSHVYMNTKYSQTIVYMISYNVDDGRTNRQAHPGANSPNFLFAPKSNCSMGHSLQSSCPPPFAPRKEGHISSIGCLIHSLSIQCLPTHYWPKQCWPKDFFYAPILSSQPLTKPPSGRIPPSLLQCKSYLYYLFDLYTIL